jgi:alkylation response protein AidB-like acyl-CoA dehydrogenase
MNEIVRDVDGLLPSKSSQSLLSDTLLEEFGARAEVYDRENRFFDEDLADLRKIGYLALAVPSEVGGKGFSLPEVVREQARLAYRAPATALAINMHLYWTGTAAYLWRKGDRSLAGC